MAYTNGGDQTMSVGVLGQGTLQSGRNLQKSMLKSIKVFELKDAIEDINMPIFGGGPPLRTMIAGLYHPEKDRMIFLDADMSRPRQS